MNFHPLFRITASCSSISIAFFGILFCIPCLAEDLDSNQGTSRSRFPNFVFILTDDQGWTGTDVSMDASHPEYASDYHQTPNINKLAQQSMRFSRGYSPAPNCSPTRYANLTGKTCARLHFTDIVGRSNQRPPIGKYKLRPIAKRTKAIRAEDTTIPELLKSIEAANYTTGHFGKWHLGGGGPEKHGFDDSDGATSNREGSLGKKINDDPKRAYTLTQRACEFISDAKDSNRPFFCQVSHYAVHQAIQHRSDTLKNLANVPVGKEHTDPAYAAMVTDLDMTVGQLLDHVEELQLNDNTYVIYQADNGAPQHLSSSRPLRGFKPEIWEGGVRVPTFIRGPNIKQNSSCNVLMMGIDLLPTIWQWAGGGANELPTGLDGGSLVKSIAAANQGKDVPVERPGEVVVHSPHYILTEDLKKNQRPSSVLYEGRWKLVAWYETGEIHLFDLATDVSESKDVADQFPDVYQRLRIRLRDYLQSVDAQMPTLDPQAFGKEVADDPSDVDADGLPDRWELQNLLTWKTDGKTDVDGDGNSNRAEFEQETDPLSGSQKSTPKANVSKVSKPWLIQTKTDRKPQPVMDAQTIRAGLASHDRALYIKSGWIRDPYITLGPNGFFYLTGTQPNPGDPEETRNPYNLGLGDESIVGEFVRAYRSRDLIEWESLGEIYPLASSPQFRSKRKANSTTEQRVLWAPEIHWLGDRWALVHCPGPFSSLALSKGPKLSGPWDHPMGAKFGRRHDPSIFTDDDGTRYLLWGNTLVAQLNADLSGYASKPVRIDPSGFRKGPDGKQIKRIGHEGATMIKIGQKYVHFGTAWSTDRMRKGSYNLYYSVADQITGPYGPRQFAGRFLGHGTPFLDKQGRWWCTAFFNANVPPLPREDIETRDLGETAQTINEQGVTIVPLDVRQMDNGKISIRAKDPAYASPGPDEAQEFDLAN